MNAHQLARQFLSLPHHTRIKIAQKLNLLPDGDPTSRPTIELCQDIFRNAIDKNVVVLLEAIVKDHYTPKSSQTENSTVESLIDAAFTVLAHDVSKDSSIAEVREAYDSQSKALRERFTQILNKR